MNRRLLTVAAAGTAAAFALALPLSAAPPGTNHKQSADQPGATCSGGADNALVIHAPTTLWPPNHKYFTDIHVLATGDEGESITLTTTGTHDQYEGDSEARGSGNTTDDITTYQEDPAVTTSDDGQTVATSETADGSVQTNWQARAERAGTIKPGRNYTITANAVYEDGGECDQTFTFSVPHDMRKSTRPTA